MIILTVNLIMIYVFCLLLFMGIQIAKKNSFMYFLIPPIIAMLIIMAENIFQIIKVI